MRIKSILTLLVCFLLAGFTMPVIACPPGDCDDCETWNSETEMCEWDCSNGQCCDGGSCVDDCPTGSCCDGSCCDSGNCCNSTTCCPNSDDVCCTDSGSYCCDSGKTCCQGSCCTAGQCCDDGTCVDDCPTGECCDEGKCEPMEMDSVTSDKASACVGCDIMFTATTDPTGYEDDVEWSGGGEPDTGSGATFTTHWGTSGTKTLIAELCDSSVSKQVTIVKVGKVVESGTTDEGPIAPGCPGTSVSLEAKPSPEESSFPTGEPHWTVEGPTGSSPSLSDDTGTTVTLSGTDKLGNYEVTAKCGESDTGDSIIVSFNLGNESIWWHYNPSSGEIPIPCRPWICDGEDSTEYDDCENELEVSCCESDGAGGTGGCAYHYFYNDGLISSCIFDTKADNIWLYKEATIDGTELRFFTKLKHVNADLDGDEGCAGYFCTKIEIYDCLTGEYDPDSPYWRRDTDSAPLDIDQGEECPGH